MGCFFNKQSSRKSLFKQTVKVGKYTVTKDVQIGVGGYAQIWKCKDVHSHQIYALKQIKLQNEELLQMFERECRIMRKLENGKNVIHIKDYQIKNDSNSFKVSKPKLGYILMQLGEISLFDYLANRKLNASQISLIIGQIANGLKQLHENSIFHLDLKLQNIMLVRNPGSSGKHPYTYKITDFGSALENKINLKQLSKVQKIKLEQYIQSYSTLIYRAPEMVDLSLKINNNIDAASDVWMLGCIAYLLLFRKHPFEQGQKLAIISCDVSYQKGIESNDKSIQLIQTIQGMLVRQSQKRFKVQQIIQRCNLFQQ